MDSQIAQLAENAPFFEDLFAHAPMVKLPIFEGPLDLLLYLIRRDEINIYDIPIARLTDQYLQVLRAMQQVDMDIAGEFFVMATTLMLIKSRMLTASELGEAPEEDNSLLEGPDPRWSLAQQLLEYVKTKERAAYLEGRIALAQNFISRSATPEETAPALQREIQAISRLDLWQSWNSALEKLKEHLKLAQISDDPEATLTNRMKWLLERLLSVPRYRFQDIFAQTDRKPLWAATFLASLELTRLGETQLIQADVFEDLWIIKKCAPDP